MWSGIVLYEQRSGVRRRPCGIPQLDRAVGAARQRVGAVLRVARARTAPTWPRKLLVSLKSMRAVALSLALLLLQGLAMLLCCGLAIGGGKEPVARLDSALHAKGYCASTNILNASEYDEEAHLVELALARY